jgi:hypothetical protein
MRRKRFSVEQIVAVHQIRAHHLPLRRSHCSRRKSYLFPCALPCSPPPGSGGEVQMIITGEIHMIAD